MSPFLASKWGLLDRTDTAKMANDFRHNVPNIMNLLDGLRAFTATAETGSFTAGAERLGVSNRLTSKHVAELEAQLGVRLFQRTTRKLGLTTAGEVMLARAPALLEELDSLLAEVSEGSRGFTGGLRISAPVNFGERHVQVMLAEFAALHPGLSIDLRLSDAHVDLAAEGIDLAFRIGFGGNSTLKRRKLGEVGSVLVASPDYLALRPPPVTPQDLRHHACIVDTNRADPARWIFMQNRVPVAVEVPSRFRVNSAQVARDLAQAGQGVAYCPAFVLDGDLEAGRLIRLLPGMEGPPHPLHAVYLEGRSLPRKLRALMDFAQDHLRKAGF